MPGVSDKVIITNHTIQSRTPVHLELSCVNNGGVMQHHVSLSDTNILLKRNNIRHINNITISFDLPSYMGCNKIDFGNDKYFRHGETGLEINTLTLQNINPDGKLGASVESTGQGVVSLSKYKYSITWNNLGMLLYEFTGCNMILKPGKLF